jgi:hypothetical protein
MVNGKWLMDVIEGVWTFHDRLTINHPLMMMLSRRTEAFCTGQLVSQIGGLVDEYRQALRADVNFIALIFDG